MKTLSRQRTFKAKAVSRDVSIPMRLCFEVKITDGFSLTRAARHSTFTN